MGSPHLHSEFGNRFFSSATPCEKTKYKVRFKPEKSRTFHYLPDEQGYLSRCFF